MTFFLESFYYSLTSKFYLIIIIEALRAAKMHNLDLKFRENSYVNAYYSITRRTSEVNN